MRIVIAAEHTELGAAEKYAIWLASGLGKLGRSVVLLAPPGLSETAKAWNQDDSYEVEEVPAGVAARGLVSTQLLARYRPDVVHANHPVSPVLIAARLLRVPARVVTDHVLPMSPRYNARGSALHSLTRMAATHLIVFSEQNALYASASWGDLPLTVIHPGIRHGPCRLSREEMRLHLGFTSQDFVVCCVGRLSVEKGQETLIRAIAEARSKVGSIRGLLVGDGSERKRLEALLEELSITEAVILTGHRLDVECFLSSADLYVQPSTREGFGFAFVEAMAAGLPVIASDLPSLREVAGNDDVPLVRPNDHEALALEIIKLHADKNRATDLGRKLQARFYRNFTVERMASNHEQLYCRLLNEAG